MRIYIAGPVSGHADYNRPAFEEAARVVREHGHAPVVPIDLEPVVPGQEKSWNYYMRLALRALLDTEAVLVLPGWMNSRGATIERSLALELDMPVYHSLTELVDCMTAWRREFTG
ncbi:nucleoside deoxyribosyltransferase [Gordonia phage RedWattleHog]|uniref:Deoxycytidylate deaminase n=1 Tax=Gordonia phage Stormageddon TaxID=2656541 RepID=A0A649VTU3_9CAUD|nr:nucleoside 2-deoxyribosyltransferase [Gordonia phage Stormageddon]QGJ94983.1 deoxycytidylate deaminase [Gordonia phage Stormageddon]QLF83627.1 nucleoside deoxyribosyltransferase [Gordonia phage RedWattleHog]